MTYQRPPVLFTCREPRGGDVRIVPMHGSILLYLIIGLAIIAALGAIAAKIYDAGRDAERLDWEKKAAQQRQAEELRIASAAAALEVARGKAKPVYRTITQTVDRLVDRPVYRNVCVDDDGLRCINAALRGESAAGCGPDSGVPGAQPAGR